ncbi:hypothetical protein HRG12_03530 [Enterococcus faecalis]|nr:hypothetical protein [Enterococcus faecalis]
MLEKFREDIISISGIRDNKKNDQFFFDEASIFGKFNLDSTVVNSDDSKVFSLGENVTGKNIIVQTLAVL